MKKKTNDMIFECMLAAFIRDTKKSYGRDPTAKEIFMLVTFLKDKFNIDLPLIEKGVQENE